MRKSYYIKEKPPGFISNEITSNCYTPWQTEDLKITQVDGTSVMQGFNMQILPKLKTQLGLGIIASIVMVFSMLFTIPQMTMAQTTDFNSFSIGTVNYQGVGSTIVTSSGYTIPDPYGSLWTVSDEWGFTPVVALDEGVVDDGSGNLVWRISNAVTQGGFSNLPYSPSSALVAGESTASLWNDRGDNHTAPLNPSLARASAATQDFHANLKFRSATGSAQPGLSLSLSAAPRQGNIRQSFISISDNGSTGFNIGFFDTNATGGFDGSTIASDLSYADWHEIDIYITFVDGLNGDGTGNDVVNILLDGNLIHTGTTWETYYALTPSFTQSPYAVDALMFRVSGTAATALAGNGIYFDDVTIDNIPLSAGPANVRVYSDAAETNLISSHTTIQAAIDAATTLSGYVVRVDAGTYEEQVTVDKPLSLLGPNSAVSGTGSRVDEAIVQFPTGLPNGSYRLATINAENVTISGFTLNDNLTGALTYDGTFPLPLSASGVWNNESNAVVENNRFFGFNNSAIRMTQSNAQNQATIVAKSNNITRHNYFEGGAVFHCIYYQASGGLIDNNHLVDVAAGVQVQPYRTNAKGTVSNNQLSMYASGLYHNFANYNTDGALWTFNNNTVTAPSADPVWNKLTFNGSPRSWDGLRLESYLGDTPDVSRTEAPQVNFSENTINGSGATIAKGWSAVYGAYLRNVKGDVATNLTNITFSTNTFSDVLVGVQFEPTTDVEYALSSLYVDGNSYPMGMGIIPPYQIAFCNGGLVTNITQGTSFCSIQVAIDNANVNDVIQVAAGTYEEQVTVDKQLDIRGAGNSTIITNPGGTAITYAASGSGAASDDRAYLKNVKISGSVKGILAADVVNYLTLDDVSIDGNSSYGIHVNNVSGTMKDWVITNSTFNANSDGFRMGMAANLDGLTINGTTFTNQVGSAIYIPQQSTSPGGFSNVTITDNTFTDNAANSNNNAAMYIEKMNNAIISGNTMTNNGFNGVAPNARGIIVNLKFGSYSNIEITGNTIIEDRNLVTSLTKGYGLYFASGPVSPAGTLSGLKVTNNEIDGFWHAIELGAGIDRSNILIKNNKINNVQIGVLAYSATSSSGTQITENSFTNLVGTTPYAIATADAAGTPIAATCNWFGSADLATFEGLIFGDVTFVPFLNNGTDNDPAIGFQPVPGACDPPDNEAPVVTNVLASPAALGTDATLTADATDNVAVTAASYTIDGGTAVPFSFDPGSPVSLSASISGLDVGVYKVCVTAEDAAGNISVPECAYLSVFDPSASFVTGGGWINSPEGALAADPNVIGRANFGFVSRYKKGKNGFTSEVDGNTEFQFQAGVLSFKSTMHESGSLVISGQRATYRGTGTINGQAGYKFVVVAIDGHWNGQNNPDRFRIKISTTSDVVIYDNQMGSDENTEDATVIGGGSIVIHEVKTKGKNKRVEDLGTMEEQLNALFENGETELESNKILVYPNPASETSNIRVSLSQDADVTIRIFDSAGRLVMEERGYHETSFVRTLNLQSFSNGIYHVVVQINHQVVTKRLVKQ